MQKLNFRQQVLKTLYPFLLQVTKLLSKNAKIETNENSTLPPMSLYDLSITLNNGGVLPLASLQGKKILIVNSASNCGYTAQYAELQKLYERSKDHLEIIGVPANDFKEQEKGNDDEIARFCSVNFGVAFPLAKKSVVIKSPHQNPVFKWLSDKNLNGWNDKPPAWNFSKYLVNENGVLTHYFESSVSPFSEEVLNAVGMDHVP